MRKDQIGWPGIIAHFGRKKMNLGEKQTYIQWEGKGKQKNFKTPNDGITKNKKPWELRYR